MSCAKLSLHWSVIYYQLSDILGVVWKRLLTATDKYGNSDQQFLVIIDGQFQI